MYTQAVCLVLTSLLYLWMQRSLCCVFRMVNIPKHVERWHVLVCKEVALFSVGFIPEVGQGWPLGNFRLTSKQRSLTEQRMLNQQENCWLVSMFAMVNPVLPHLFLILWDNFDVLKTVLCAKMQASLAVLLWMLCDWVSLQSWCGCHIKQCFHPRPCQIFRSFGAWSLSSGVLVALYPALVSLCSLMLCWSQELGKCWSEQEGYGSQWVGMECRTSV